jgi:hypothetical protein
MTVEVDTKSTKALAAEYLAEYKKIEHFKEDLDARVAAAVQVTREFRVENTWYAHSSRYYFFVESYPWFTTEDITEDGINFRNEDESYLSFDDIDNALEIIENEYLADMGRREESDRKFVLAQREKLQRELAELDAKLGIN